MNKMMMTVIGSAVTAAVSLGIAAVTEIRNRRLIKKLNKSIDRIEDASEEKIADEIVEKAVFKAADKHVDEYMKKTEIAVLKTADRNLEIQAKNAVERCANDIRKKTSEEIGKQVANLDVEQLKRRVCDQAEKHVLEKLDGCLDESAKQFKKQLELSQKTYSSLVKVVSDKKDEEGNGIRVMLI